MTIAGDSGSGDGAWTAVGPEDAPAIVFLHGTRTSRGQWTPQLRRLSRRYRCVAVDLPGHGARAGEAFSMASAAGVVAGAIEAAVPAGRAIVVGLSLGGYVAIETAERFPDRVRGLVLAGCSAEPAGVTAKLMRALAWTLERVPAGVLRPVNTAFFRARYPRAVADPIVSGGFWFAGGAAALRALVGHRFLDRLGRLWTPVLIVNGALDPVFGPGGKLWAAACRSGRVVVSRGAGHLSSLDRPAAFAAQVDAFARAVAAVDEASAERG